MKAIIRVLAEADARPTLSTLLARHGGVAETALARLRDDPYDEMRRSGGSLESAECIARQFTLSFPRRVLGHASWELASKPLMSLSTLTVKVRLSMELPESSLRGVLGDLLASDQLKCVDGFVVSPDYYEKNTTIARDVTSRAISVSNRAMTAAFSRIEDVTPEQRAALDMVASHRISIVTGGPGSGKSHLVRAMCAAVDRVKVTAPTGRAARNAHGKTVAYFKTIQESGKNEFSGAELVIVDEASMLSTDLMWNVLSLTPASAHLVLVGDIDQLPPIDAGDILHDLLDRVPVARLTFNHRSTRGIQDFAAGVLRGAVPETFPSGVELVACESFDDALNALPGIVSRYDVMVLSPHNATRISINKALQLYTHGRDEEVEVDLLMDFADVKKGTRGIVQIRDDGSRVRVFADGDVHFDATLAAAIKMVSLGARASLENGIAAAICESGTFIAPGDPIIVTKNTTDACNGDIGIFTRGVFGAKTTGCDAVFVGETETESVSRKIPRVSASDPGLTLAYAVTVHKSQGSEFETVILPVTNPGAWDRALLYTAITRAKSRVILLGSLDDVRSIAACVRPARPSILKTFLKHE